MTLALFGVAAVPAVTVMGMAWIACSPGWAAGCGLIFHRRVVKYDLVAQSGKPTHGLPSLMGSIKGREGNLLTMEPRRPVCFWFMLSSAWRR